MQEILRYRQTLLDRLEIIVDDLRSAWAAIPPSAQMARRSPGAPSPLQILAHLQAVESQAFAVRLRRILDENCPSFELFDDEQWLAQHPPAAGDGAALLDDYARLRAEELRWLRPLPPSAWNRLARHPWHGLRTLQWWVEQCLQHAQNHLDELSGKELS